MPDQSPRSQCTVTGASGTVRILAPGMGTITLSPARAVEISNRLLEAAALANGQHVWNRG